MLEYCVDGSVSQPWPRACAYSKGRGSDDGLAEDHDLNIGKHLAAYIRSVDVPAWQRAFHFRAHQIGHLVAHLR